MVSISGRDYHQWIMLYSIMTKYITGKRNFQENEIYYFIPFTARNQIISVVILVALVSPTHLHIKNIIFKRRARRQALHLSVDHVRYLRARSECGISCIRTPLPPAMPRTSGLNRTAVVALEQYGYMRAARRRHDRKQPPVQFISNKNEKQWDSAVHTRHSVCTACTGRSRSLILQMVI